MGGSSIFAGSSRPDQFKALTVGALRGCNRCPTLCEASSPTQTWAYITATTG